MAKDLTKDRRRARAVIDYAKKVTDMAEKRCRDAKIAYDKPYEFEEALVRLFADEFNRDREA